MVTVAIYIYIGEVYKRIELFNDEKISITSSVQDVSDISKVFTDYSQSFTVPASHENNLIFGHWYENSLQNGFDARIRKDAYVEIDSVIFRRGKIQLEKAQLKNGFEIQSYTITFFGSLIALKEGFNERLLREFDFTSIEFTYNGLNVANKVTGDVNSDIKFPLITSGNVWQYDTGGTTATNWDISNSATPIYTSDLYPAVRVSRIFEIIAADLGITFDSDFLSDVRFGRLFLWLKNADGLITIQAQPTLIFYNYFDVIDPDVPQVANKFSVYQSKFNYDGGRVYDEFGDEVFGGTGLVNSGIEITFTTTGSPFKFMIYFNGSKVSELDLVTSSLNSIYLDYAQGIGSYTFYISSVTPLTYTSTFYYDVSVVSSVSGLTVYNHIAISTGAPQSNSGTLNVANYMPDIKAEDFFSGILKMFNLTCYSETAGIFKIAQLEDWYNSGDVIDITKYVIMDDINMDRVTTYKLINFNYEKSESILNANFKATSVNEYGDLVYNVGVDGSEYSVKLPFENLLFQKFTDTNLQVGYSLKPDLKPYKPKPIILYDYGTIQSADYYLSNGISTSLVNDYNCFGQDTNILGTNYTINWGIEQSTFTDSLESNTLFQNYYSNYISNIFNQQARKINIKAVLPLSILTGLKLNDRVVIRDKRYVINSFTTDLTSGVIDLDLLTDFRTL
jgi:hypothetical protein